MVALSPPMVAIRPGIAGVFTLAGVLLAPMVGSPAPAPPPSCKNVVEAILGAARDMRSGGALSRMAPYMPPDSVAVLSGRLSREQSPGLELWLALGRTQDASALVAMRALRPSSALEDRLGHALSLLALGDGSETGTITQVLTSGPEPARLQVATELTHLWGVRPRDLLYPVLEDPSPEVRLVAARHLSSWSTRARRALQELSDGPEASLRAQALEALVERGQRLPMDRVQRLSPPYRARALLKEASRGSSLANRELRQDLKSSDAATRTFALAALAALAGESADSLKRLAERARPAGDLEPELSMARLLLGDRGAQETLRGADREGIQRAVDVLWLFTASKLKTANPDATVVSAFLPVTEAWLIQGKPEEPVAARLFQAVEVLDADFALRLARARILGPAGLSFERACQNLARGGQLRDAETLLAAARRLSDEEARASALTAAARICAR